MSVFSQIVILLIVLSCMVMALLAIRQLGRYEKFDDSEDTIKLQDEVENDGNILTDHNIFHNLVETPVHNEPEDNYNSNSTDPFSRRE